MFAIKTKLENWAKNCIIAGNSLRNFTINQFLDFTYLMIFTVSLQKNTATDYEISSRTVANDKTASMVDACKRLCPTNFPSGGYVVVCRGKCFTRTGEKLLIRLYLCCNNVACYFFLLLMMEKEKLLVVWCVKDEKNEENYKDIWWLIFLLLHAMI